MEEVKISNVNTVDPAAQAIEDAKVKAAVDGVVAPASTEGLILGKFADQSALEKGYQELERKQSEGTPVAPVVPVTEPPKDGLGIPPKTAEQLVSEAGFDVDALAAEYEQNGELTAETMSRLDKAGWGKPVVDQYFAGLKAQSVLLAQSVHGQVGGEENYNAMIQWASTNLSEVEINAFNDTVNAGGASAALAVSGLRSRQVSSEGTGDPTRTISGAPSAAQSETFSSWAQCTAAMKDPRYETDKSYRAEVERRLAISNI